MEKKLGAIGQVSPAKPIENLDRQQPPGLAAVFIMIGGTAPISTAFFTRRVPWRPM
jgi:hypothetical protein